MMDSYLTDGLSSMSGTPKSSQSAMTFWGALGSRRSGLNAMAAMPMTLMVWKNWATSFSESSWSAKKLVMMSCPLLPQFSMSAASSTMALDNSLSRPPAPAMTFASAKDGSNRASRTFMPTPSVYLKAYRAFRLVACPERSKKRYKPYP